MIGRSIFHNFVQIVVQSVVATDRTKNKVYCQFSKD